MSSYQNPYSPQGNVVAFAQESERADFIQRTYLHLAGAIIAFVMIEAILLTIFPPAQLLQNIAPLMDRWTWLLIIGAFMGVSWMARSWADSNTSRAMQYAGLSVYVVAEALIFLPMMAISTLLDPTIPLYAGVITTIVFASITAFAFITKSDFSGLGRFLWLAGMAALAVVVVGAFMGFGLGLWFSGLMVLLASGYILYDTSNIIHRYRTDQHVAASLALFASVALLLWYVMRILIALKDD